MGRDTRLETETKSRGSITGGFNCFGIEKRSK